MNDWEEALAFALSFPSTELSTSYGKPAAKVNGKSFLSPGREQGSFAVASPLNEKELLMETDPDTGKRTIIEAGPRSWYVMAVAKQIGSSW